MSAAKTEPEFVLQAAHVRRSTTLTAELKELLQSHLTIAHALRTDRQDASANTIRAREDAFESTFLQITTRVEELRQLEAAAAWIDEHAHLVRVKG